MLQTYIAVHVYMSECVCAACIRLIFELLTIVSIHPFTPGSTLQLFLTVGLIKSSGILFVAFQERFQSTSAMTSLLSTVQNFTYSITGALVDFFETRTRMYSEIYSLTHIVGRVCSGGICPLVEFTTRTFAT